MRQPDNPKLQKPFNANAIRCRLSTFDTIWISDGWTSRINFRCLLPLDLLGKTSGSIFFSTSSVRTPLWKEGALEQTLRMLSVNGKLRNCAFWIIKRMILAIHGFSIDNIAAQNAIEGSKALHARRWQMKDGIYRSP